MPTEPIETFLKKHDSKISFARYVIFPILVAATFFFLDARYAKKDSYEAANTEMKIMITKSSSEQKEAIGELTKAITALTIEQRNQLESQRSNSSAISSVNDKLVKHENTDAPAWSKVWATIDRVDDRLDKLESTSARHDATISRNTEIIFRLQDKVK